MAEGSAGNDADVLDVRLQGDGKALHGEAAGLSTAGLWTQAFRESLPILFSYLPVGFAFGMAFVDRAGCDWWWASLCSFLIVAVAAEFVLLGMIVAGAGWLPIAVAMMLMNARYLFFGITLIERYKKIPFWTRLYLIFALTPGTYSLITSASVPRGVQPPVYYRALTVLCHCYTVLSASLGALTATYMDINTKGFEFALTALFVVFLIEQWFIVRVWTPFVVALGCGAAAFMFFPPNHFLLASMALTLAVLLGIRQCLMPRA